MHLFLVQNFEIISGCQEESFKEIPPDSLMLLRESTPREARNVATKNFKDHPPQNRCNDHVQSRGVILSYLLKGEPPDTHPIPKPKQYQSKALESQKRMKADLLYLDAGYTVSRLKLFQEGEDVAVRKTVAQPESHQTFQTGHLGDTSDQKDFWHETNFHRRLTKQFITEAWNYKKIFMDEEVMDFTN